MVSRDLQSTFALHSLSRLCDALGAEERAVRVLLKKHKGGISRLSLVLDPVQVQSHSIFQKVITPRRRGQLKIMLNEILIKIADITLCLVLGMINFL